MNVNSRQIGNQGVSREPSCGDDDETTRMEVGEDEAKSNRKEIVVDNEEEVEEEAEEKAEAGEQGEKEEDEDEEGECPMKKVKKTEEPILPGTDSEAEQKERDWIALNGKNRRSSCPDVRSVTQTRKFAFFISAF